MYSSAQRNKWPLGSSAAVALAVRLVDAVEEDEDEDEDEGGDEDGVGDDDKHEDDDGDDGRGTSASSSCTNAVGVSCGGGSWNAKSLSIRTSYSFSAATVNSWNEDRYNARDVSCNLNAKVNATAAAWATATASTLPTATANHASKIATALRKRGSYRGSSQCGENGSLRGKPTFTCRGFATRCTDARIRRR